MTPGPAIRWGNLGLRQFMTFIGILLTSLGAVVLVGWIFDFELLVQIHPTWVPMQFNTASGFLISGIALLCSVFKRSRIATTLGFVIMLIGFLTLLQYIFGVDLRIDELFMKHHITVKTSHPGRMAPNSALCFFLTGLVLFLVNANPQLQKMTILGTAVVGFGLIAFTGYVLGIETSYGWGHLTRMAMHTSLGFILVGFALSTWGFLLISDERKTSGGWAIISIAVILFVFVLGQWQGLKGWEDKKIHEDVANELYVFSNAIELSMSRHINAVQRKVDIWEHTSISKERWEQDSEHLRQDYPNLIALGRFDAAMENLWKMPSEQTWLASNGNTLFQTPQGRELLDLAKDADMVVSKAVTTASDQAVVLIKVPLSSPMREPESVVAMFSLEQIFSPPNDLLVLDHFHLIIRQNNRVILGDVASLQPIEAAFKATRSVAIENLNWEAELYPKKAYVSQMRSSLPNLVLISGILGIFTLFLLDHQRRRAREMSSKLGEEVERRTQIEDSLVRSRGELRTILDTAQEGVCGLDERGNITFANPMACFLVGCSFVELKGTSIKAFFGHDDPELSEDEYTAAKKSDVHFGETQIQKKSGMCIPVAFTKNSIEDQYGTFVGTVITFQDISQRKIQENSITRYTQELERSNKALDDFAYVASHDLKAPLRGITQLAGWIKEDIQDSLKDQTKTYFSLLENRVARLERLLDDLLYYSRAGHKHGDFKTVDIEELARETFNLLAPPNGFVLETFIAISSISTLVTPLELILRNLISNAIKHHDANRGTITVSAKYTDSGYEFCIADDGPGIPEEQAQRVFRIFQTLKPRDQVEGSGMGLAIVKKVLDCYRCQITVQPNDERGTRMVFTWPKEEYLRRWANA